MMSRETVTITIYLEWKYLDKTIFMSSLSQKVRDHFENDEMKTYYVTRMDDNIRIKSHKINSNNQWMIDVECDCELFTPSLGVLSMTVEDIDKKEFVILRHPVVDKFKVFVSDCRLQHLNVHDTVDVNIQALKNRKNNIIAIGQFLEE